MRGVDGERHEHREDSGGEDFVDAFPVGVVEVGPGFDVDPRLVEGGFHEVAERGGMAGLQDVRLLADGGERVERFGADVGGHGEPRHDAPFQPGDAHHEELVQVVREDGEEVDAFEERNRFVLGEFEHALVEGEPAELAVEEPVGWQGAVVDPGRVVVVIETVRGEPGVVEVTLRIH